MLAVQFNPNDSMASVGELFGGTPLVAVILVVAAIAIGTNNALNFYGSMLNLITAVTWFRPVVTSVRIRAVMLEATFVIGLLVAPSRHPPTSQRRSGSCSHSSFWDSCPEVRS